MKIVYIADFFLPTNKAYSIHVFQMLDAFGKLGLKSKLLIPYYNKHKIKESIKFYGLLNKNKIQIHNIFSNKINLNFITRIFFGIFAAYAANKINSKNLIITRSLSSSVFLSLFKIYHFLEIHQEIRGLSKFLLIDLNFINSKYIIRNIFISKSLAKFYKKKTKKFKILHDGVNLERFILKKKIKNVQKISYIGSFYKGRGIELILKLAKYFNKINFNLYGKSNKLSINNIKNFHELKKKKNTIFLF